MILTIDEARSYAHDYESPDDDIMAMIDVVEAMIEDGVRTDFDHDSPQAKMLARIYVADLTDNRSSNESQASTRRYMVSSLIGQLRYKKSVSNSDT